MAGLFRKVIRIRAEDSPNVVARRDEYPGLLSWEEYLQRRATWDPIRQCVGLDAQFYAGPELRLFPVEWLERALASERQPAPAANLRPGIAGAARVIGCDPAEGGDKTAWAVADDGGLIELQSVRTPDTAVITSTTLALMRRYQVPDEGVVFDLGGGGKQHADRLRAQGWKRVRTVAFGEAVVPPPETITSGVYKSHRRRVEEREERWVYKNRRAEMYGSLRDRLDPQANPGGFALRASRREDLDELVRQLSLIPLTYDPEGRLELLPKNARAGGDATKTLVGIIGNSPDEADALALAVYALEHPWKHTVAGGV